MKKFKEFVKENDEYRYLSDEEIESGYDDFIILNCKVEKLFDDGGASGMIELEFPNSEDYKVDNWIKYDSGPKIAFDNWYPTSVNIKLKEHIEKCVKEERIKRESDKYNL